MYNKMKRRNMSHGGIFSSLGDFDETSLASSNLLKKITENSLPRIYG